MTEHPPLPGDISEELLSAYLDDELTLPERQQVESALEQRADLRDLLAELTQIRAQIQNLPKFSLPADFTAKVIEACTESTVNAETITTANAESKLKRHDSRTRWRMGIAASAALILISLWMVNQNTLPSFTDVAAMPADRKESEAVGDSGLSKRQDDTVRQDAARGIVKQDITESAEVQPVIDDVALQEADIAFELQHEPALDSVPAQPRFQKSLQNVRQRNAGGGVPQTKRRSSAQVDSLQADSIQADSAAGFDAGVANTRTLQAPRHAASAVIPSAPAMAPSASALAPSSPPAAQRLGGRRAFEISPARQASTFRWAEQKDSLDAVVRLQLTPAEITQLAAGIANNKILNKKQAIKLNAVAAGPSIVQLPRGGQLAETNAGNRFSLELMDAESKPPQVTAVQDATYVVFEGSQAEVVAFTRSLRSPPQVSMLNGQVGLAQLQQLSTSLGENLYGLEQLRAQGDTIAEVASDAEAIAFDNDGQSQQNESFGSSPATAADKADRVSKASVGEGQAQAAASVYRVLFVLEQKNP